MRSAWVSHSELVPSYSSDRQGRRLRKSGAYCELSFWRSFQSFERSCLPPIYWMDNLNSCLNRNSMILFLSRPLEWKGDCLDVRARLLHSLPSLASATYPELWLPVPPFGMRRILPSHYQAIGSTFISYTFDQKCWIGNYGAFHYHIHPDLILVSSGCEIDLLECHAEQDGSSTKDRSVGTVQSNSWLLPGHLVYCRITASLGSSQSNRLCSV